MQQLESNKVNSNAFINSILFTCMQVGYYPGFRYESSIKAYNLDQANHLRDNHIFELSPAGQVPNFKGKSLCEVTNIYNQMKFDRITKS